jgi:hypothetical protein
VSISSYTGLKNRQPPLEKSPFASFDILSNHRSRVMDERRSPASDDRDGVVGKRRKP